MSELPRNYDHLPPATLDEYAKEADLLDEIHGDHHVVLAASGILDKVMRQIDTDCMDNPMKLDEATDFGSPMISRRALENDSANQVSSTSLPVVVEISVSVSRLAQAGDSGPKEEVRYVPIAHVIDGIIGPVSGFTWEDAEHAASLARELNGLRTLGPNGTGYLPYLSEDLMRIHDLTPAQGVWRPKNLRRPHEDR